MEHVATDGRRRGPFHGVVMAAGLLFSLTTAGCRTEEDVGEAVSGICVDQGGGPGALVRTIGGCRQVELLAMRTFQHPQMFDASLAFSSPMRFALPNAIPVLVGNAGNRNAHLFYTSATGAQVDCTYQGGSSQSHPTSPSEVQNGRQYLFSSCTNQARAGDVVPATGFSLRVDGDQRDPARVVIGRLVLDEAGPCGNADAGADRDAGTDTDSETVDADVSDRANDADVAPEAPDAETGLGDADGDVLRSTRCGDAIRDPVLEECDLGANVSSRGLCTPECRVRDLLAVVPLSDALSPPARVLGEGRHPLSVDSSGSFAVVFSEPDADPFRLSLTAFGADGAASDRVTSVSAGATPLFMSNPVLAAVPGGQYAVAFTDFNGDGDELGVAIRLVHPIEGPSAALTHANVTTLFSQYDADIIATASGLVVAWIDSASVTSPDVKYRTFDFDLRPTSGELDLASSSANEGDVALAPWSTGWAAAWRAGADGLETLRIRAGTIEWTIGPYLPGPAGSRPALAELDATHLLVVYAEGVDVDGGSGFTSKVRAAVLDAAAPGSATAFDISPTIAALADRAQDQPNLVRAADHVFVVWRSHAEPGDSLGEELWLKEVIWNGDSLGVDASEIPLPRATIHRAGDQRRPAMAAGPLFPLGHQLVVAFDDLGRTFGSGEGNGDVAVEAIPVPLVRFGAGDQ